MNRCRINVLRALVIIWNIMLSLQINVFPHLTSAYLPHSPLIYSSSSTTRSSSHLDKFYVDHECDKKCCAECVSKLRCEPRKFLIHCLNVCELICSFEAPEPPPAPLKSKKGNK